MGSIFGSTTRNTLHSPLHEAFLFCLVPVSSESFSCPSVTHPDKWEMPSYTKAPSSSLHKRSYGCCEQLFKLIPPLPIETRHFSLPCRSFLFASLLNIYILPDEGL
uniref:Uncharacterized protein n=1 Tax=Sphaerodactylus townsendi TaxID=933632 RepID=A0ACB8E9K0_9SAUR